jgi:hypothetical protein
MQEQWMCGRSSATPKRIAALRYNCGGTCAKNGARPWIDVDDIPGGDDWKQEIGRAIDESSHFIALISDRSVNKRGFVQKELRQAIDVLETFPPGEVFVIPVRLELDGSEPRHNRLAELHWIDLFPDYREDFRKLLRSLRLEAAAPEPIEYQSHEPASRQAPQIPAGAVAKDDEGFLTSTSVGQLVLALFKGANGCGPLRYFYSRTATSARGWS